MRRFGILFVLAYGGSLMMACGDDIEHFDSEDDGGSNPLGIAGCEDVGWRNPSPGRVLCPGAAGCGCDLPTICCFDGSSLEDSWCGAREECTGQIISCDGPEDCGLGEVCCANDIEARCVPDGECSVVEEQLCREDDDCPGTVTQDTCEPGEPPVIGHCDAG